MIVEHMLIFKGELVGDYYADLSAVLGGLLYFVHHGIGFACSRSTIKKCQHIIPRFCPNNSILLYQITCPHLRTGN